jgi:hypothetical protein
VVLKSYTLPGAILLEIPMLIGTYVLDVTVTHHFIRSGNTCSMFTSFILGEREEEG